MKWISIKSFYTRCALVGGDIILRSNTSDSDILQASEWLATIEASDMGGVVALPGAVK